jgi:polysaccharide deacetylase 2 family uncharacterized protein YibQ
VSAKRSTAQVPQARLVVFLVTMIVVLTGILVGLILRPPDSGADEKGEVAVRLPIAPGRAAPMVGPEFEPPPLNRPLEAVPAPQPAPRPAPRSPAGDIVPPPAEGARLAIVIDDAGNNLQELRPFLGFPAPLTFAVLPQLRHSAGAAELVRSHGHEVILHLPMAAVSGLYPGPGTITAELSDDEIRHLLKRNFASITGAAGTNNHMGSAGTSDPRIMNTVMAHLAEMGKFFVDSRTTPSSVAAAYAAKYGVPFMERDVFLDHDRDPAAIRAALRDGLGVARKHGFAVLIGHSSVAAVAEALFEVYPQLERQGYEVVPLSALFPPGAAQRVANGPVGGGHHGAGP